MLTYLGISPAFLAGFPASAETTRARVPSANGGGHEEGMITVMNPAIAGKLAARVPLVPPLDSLQGKKIYMVNLSWEGPDAANYFYGAMTEWLGQALFRRQDNRKSHGRGHVWQRSFDPEGHHR